MARHVICSRCGAPCSKDVGVEFKVYGFVECYKCALPADVARLEKPKRRAPSKPLQAMTQIEINRCVNTVIMIIKQLNKSSFRKTEIVKILAGKWRSPHIGIALGVLMNRGNIVAAPSATMIGKRGRTYSKLYRVVNL